MHNPAQFLDDLKGAAVLADGFVRQGGYVCNHDAWLAGWLKQLPAEQLLTLDGYAALLKDLKASRAASCTACFAQQAAHPVSAASCDTRAEQERPPMRDA